jgi:hypothetical protein
MNETPNWKSRWVGSPTRLAKMLKRLARANGTDFCQNGVEFADALHVYVLNNGIEKANGVVRINMQQIFEKTLTFHSSHSSGRR